MRITEFEQSCFGKNFSAKKDKIYKFFEGI